MITENDFKQLNYNILGTKTGLEGDFKLQGDTIIAGKFNGTITVLDDSKIILERDSVTSGQFFCHDIEVFGKFEGNIQSTGTLTVRSSGVISGKIKAKKMSIYPGAILNIEGETPEENL